MKIKKSLLTAWLLSALSPIAIADFDLGVNYYKENKFEQAYKEFLEAAQYGDHDAQHNIGAMYYLGQHVQKSEINAYAWMALAKQGASDAESSSHNKLLASMSDANKKLAQEGYEKLLSKFSDSAIDERLNPTFTGKTLGVKDQRIIKQVTPQYPTEMARQGISGFVDMTFTIDKYGFTRDHVPTYSSSKAFERETIKALRQFQFEPMKVNNKPVDVNGLTMRFNFAMEGASYDKRKLDKMVAERKGKAETGTDKDKLNYAFFLEALRSLPGDYKVIDNPNRWYIEAANQGNGVASYFLGRNILYGNMCTQDNGQSMGWLFKSAKAGVTDAQYMLAIESLSGARFEKNEEKAFYWLTRAADINNSARVRYAWILATHPESARRNGNLASQYINKVEKNYLDKQSYYQTQAAIAAENGDFKQAVKWQKKALDDAQDLKLPTLRLEQQLASYNTKTPWREEI